MKRIVTTIVAAVVGMTMAAQTLNVEVGQVVYQFPAAQAGEMTYQDGQTVTIINKAFTLADVNRMFVDNTEVTDSRVEVEYDGSTAVIRVAGNIAQYLTIEQSGAHVSITQSDDVSEEITYALSGASSDGEFYMAGSFKATVELAGLTLTNQTPVYSGAAVCIMDGKRIDLSAKSGTVNTLIDAANGDQKAALYCKGHLELKGKGTLNVSGLTAHAVKSAEYMQMKNLTLNVVKAVKDGLSCDEYFLMESGTLTISGVGDDGIQCDLDGTSNTGETADHEDEDSGNIYIQGGSLTITTIAAGTKCLKSDSTLVVSGGTLELNASGAVDTSDASDPSYVSGISCGKFVQNGGSITMTIKGTAGRGVKAWDIETNSGSLTITNAATPTTISSDVKSAKGLKGLNIALNGGTINIAMSGNAGKGISAGSGTQSSSGSSGGGWGGGWGGGRPGGGMGGGSSWSNIKGSYTQGLSDGSGPTLTVSTTGSAYSSSSAKAIKAICAVTLYGGTTEVSTKTDGAEGLESKTSVTVKGGLHYFQCYDDCINSAGKIIFDGGATVCYSNGNDAVDSNAGTSGAVTIGDGAIFAFTTKGAPEEGIDCDNNSYIQITGSGYAVSAGASQGGGGGGGWGGSSSGNTISNASQGYAFVTNSISYQSGRYYTLADASGNNLMTYSFPASCSSSLSLFTAKGMTKNSSYNVKYSTTAPTDATTAWHGLYLGSSHVGTSSVTSMTAK